MSSEDALLQPAAQNGEDPLIGMVLQERYKIVRRIGEGGMGAVYEGEHILIKRRVAIKCLHAQLAQNPEIVARFHREALAATSIGHENIVEVTDMGRFPDGSVFMVLEFLEGRDWSHDIDNLGPQPLGKVVHIVSQVADALDAAHHKGIIHRDLKPENVFLITRGGDPDFVKVLDFGISKFKDAAEGGEDKSMTKTGTTMGTPYYMAPEQAQGKKEIDHRADLYSLGVIIFQALTGQYPFDDESYPMLVLKICTEPPPPLRMYRPDIPEEVEQIIGYMLAKNPDDRYPDCASVKAALTPYRQVQDAPVVAQDAPSTANMQSSAITGAQQQQQGIQATSGVQAAHQPPAMQQQAAAEQPVGTPAPVSSGQTTYELPRSKMPLVLGLIAVVALLGGGAGLAAAMGWLGSGASAEQAEEDTTGDEAESGEQAPEEIPEGLATPDGKESVTVEISTEPKDAELYLDGHRIPNPFDGELPKTTEPRRLEVKKNGYKNVLQDLVLQFPQRVRIELEKGSGTVDKRSDELKERDARREREQRATARRGSSGSGSAGSGSSKTARRGSGGSGGTAEAETETGSGGSGAETPEPSSGSSGSTSTGSGSTSTGSGSTSTASGSGSSGTSSSDDEGDDDGLMGMDL